MELDFSKLSPELAKKAVKLLSLALDYDLLSVAEAFEVRTLPGRGEAIFLHFKGKKISFVFSPESYPHAIAAQFQVYSDDQKDICLVEYSMHVLDQFDSVDEMIAYIKRGNN